MGWYTELSKGDYIDAHYYLRVAFTKSLERLRLYFIIIYFEAVGVAFILADYY